MEESWISLFTEYFGLYTHHQWMTHFRIGPSICSEVFQQLGSDFQLIHLLMALFFLTNYHITEVAHTLFHCSEGTYRKWVWMVILRLRETLDNVR